MYRIVCVGGASVDRAYHAVFPFRPGTSNPARAYRSFGGVARNVAENLARLGEPAALVSVVGEDENGAALLQHARSCGIDTSMVVRDASQVTSEYAAFVDESGNLVAGMSDMHAIDKLAPSDLEELWPLLSGAQWLFVDCNVSADVLRWCIARAQRSSVRLAIDAVSDAKARKLPAELHGVDLLVLNESEARSYGCDDAAQLRERGAAAVVLTMGDRGAIAADQTTTPIPATAASCIDVTGAGDAFVAATLFRLLQGDSLAEAARVGSLAAALTVESKNTVRADLSTKLLEDAWTSP